MVKQFVYSPNVSNLKTIHVLTKWFDYPPSIFKDDFNIP